MVLKVEEGVISQEWGWRLGARKGVLSYSLQEEM
jgi:hypothetical protein